MILKNNAACLIAVNTSPALTQQQIDALRQNNRPIPSSFINIPPLESVEIPDEHCQSDFVQNLIKIGELIVVSSEKTASPAKEERAPVKAKAEPVKAMTAKEKKEFETLVIDAEIEGVDVSGCTTLKEVKAAMKKAGK